MTDDAGAMSIDFLAGFTIFMLSFIWVATLVPNLFLGLSAHTIDYDAVAYRTGVILVEDPGASGSLGTLGPQGVLAWEFQPDKRDVARFGLAISRDTPNILKRNKIERFFCQTAFTYPDDYQKRAIFGDYPYRFNITLKEAGRDEALSIGDVVPDNYGYIRRDVKIKQTSNATIGYSVIKKFGYNNTEAVPFNQFSLVLNTTRLLDGEVRNPAYQINPFTDRIIINITDLAETRQNPSEAIPSVPASSGYNLSAINFYQVSPGQATLAGWTPAAKYRKFVYEDGNSTPTSLPVDVRNNVSMVFEPGFFSTANPNANIYINMTFGMTLPQQYLNNTCTSPFDYNYNPENVTQPVLDDAVLEVAVW